MYLQMRKGSLAAELRELMGLIVLFFFFLRHHKHLPAESAHLFAIEGSSLDPASLIQDLSPGISS